MSQDFASALRAEIANLKAELASSVAYKRLVEARKMLALYDDSENTEASNVDAKVLAEVVEAPVYSLGQQPAQRIRRRVRPPVLHAARMYLANRVGPTPTSDIYDHLTALGFEIGGTEPRNNLSAMLSNSPLFTSHGRSGWTLAVLKEEGPDYSRADESSETEL